MIDYNSFGVVGGDRRQIALAESIASDGYTVYAFGFDTINFQKGIVKAELDEIAAKCENIILPLPVTADGKYLNTHYSEKKTPLDDTFAEYMRNKTVFGGMSTEELCAHKFDFSAELRDIADRGFTEDRVIPDYRGDNFQRVAQARAILADQGANLALFQLQADVLQSGDAGIEFAHMFDFNDGILQCYTPFPRMKGPCGF